MLVLSGKRRPILKKNFFFFPCLLAICIRGKSLIYKEERHGELITQYEWIKFKP